MTRWARSSARCSAKPFDLLLGRKTYDIFAAHWPYVGKDDPIGPLFDRITKFVATRNPDFKPTWQNSRSLGPDPVATLKTAEAGGRPGSSDSGSTDFLKTLLAHGLVDEFNVSIFPVILGKGKRLFGDAAQPVGLKLVSVQSSPVRHRRHEICARRRGPDRIVRVRHADRGGVGAEAEFSSAAGADGTIIADWACPVSCSPLSRRASCKPVLFG